jgi:hypothetical protein
MIFRCAFDDSYLSPGLMFVTKLPSNWVGAFILPTGS